MITKERLEELIEQGATIWTINKSRNINPVKTNKTCEIQRQYLMKEGQIYSYIEQTFETEEDAKWFAEFGCIERTERLELPNWEEFEKTKISVKFRNKETKYSMYVFVKNKNTNNCRIIIYADDGKQDWMVFEKPLTKENYSLACRKCKELFLGKDS